MKKRCATVTLSSASAWPWCSVCTGGFFFFVLLYALVVGAFVVFGNRSLVTNEGDDATYTLQGLSAALIIALSGGAISGTLVVWYCLVCEAVTLPRTTVRPLSHNDIDTARAPAFAAPAPAEA